jgi:DNA-binding transcriptional regulator YhcF (GntR family)/DNA-binding LacI/PurR family transcriptional regulator
MTCVICIILGMKDSIAAELRRRKRERGPVASVRELALEFGASPRTVHLALRDLAEQGLVHALPRKGFFWGPGGGAPGPVGESAEERFRARFLSDLERGTHHPWKELPTPRDLGQVYAAPPRCVGRVLFSLAEAGALSRRGRRYFPATPAVRPATGSVLVVSRCDPQGELLLDTEREIDFMKSVRKELAGQGLDLLRAGYDPIGRRFLDGAGEPIDLSRLPALVRGAIVSTWLVDDPKLLLSQMARLRIPISVWWEHSTRDFPTKGFPAGLAGFNLSFGESAGTAVGMHLASSGVDEVAFVSPYHGNDWSPARLRGLVEQIQARGGRVHEFVEPAFHSPWDLHVRGGGPAGARRLMDRTLGRFLENPRLLATPTWVLVNDEAATALLRLLRKRGIRAPVVVGFDNSSDSERLGFDSFEFHTDGMVRRMLQHIGHPRSPIFAHSPLQEMIGRLVVRSPLHRGEPGRR